MPPTKILVVEDEQLVADDLRETLELLGYEVPSLAITGEEAILQVESLRPDLVLMDIQLASELDGVQASEQIQSRFHIPVIYLTANADRLTLERVKATHPYGYILKPFDERTLSTTIEIALFRHTAETKAQQALLVAEVARQEAEAQNQSKSERLAMASHEVRNPLTAIKFTVDALQRQGDKLPAELKQKHLTRIQTAIESLITLLENLLTLEQIDSKPQEVVPVPIDVVGFCQEQIETWQFQADGQHNLIFTAPEAGCTAWLDEKLFWHVVNNLLSNAIKYSPPSSSVFLSLFCDEATVDLQIQDQGIGIPEPDLERLFAPFQRARNVETIPGTGLGLAIAKRCIDLHNGHIAVQSTEGKGTTVTVSLPKRLPV